MPQEYYFNSFFDQDSKYEKKVEAKEPKLYKVFLHNDHYTTMDFVVEILVLIFGLAKLEANKVMMEVHEKGVGTCGIFSYDIAKTKVNQVHQMARSREFPLKCSYEPL